MAPARPADNSPPADFVEEVQIAGHIIDSLILPKVLDLITAGGGTFRIKKITDRPGPQRPQLRPGRSARANSAELLAEILAQIADHGAVPTAQQDCRLVAADIDGAFPEGFYSTTNQRTEVRLDGKWIEVADQEMDCGVVVDAKARPPAACR